jgi:hypothetical protein
MKKIALWAVTLALPLLLAACANITKTLDVVGKDSVTSFRAVLEALPDKVTEDDVNGGWSLTAPDKSARFIWSRDYSKTPLHDIMIETAVAPFLAAGLNIGKLPPYITVYDGKIMLGVKLGSEELRYDGRPTPLASYEHLVNLKRKYVGYHAALDHYGVTVAEGSLFEWAKDMSKNDKDIVFVLNPEPFIAAGVDPTQVDGWLFAKVPVDVDGKSVEVDKLLKPFNLK